MKEGFLFYLEPYTSVTVFHEQDFVCFNCCVLLYITSTVTIGCFNWLLNWFLYSHYQVYYTFSAASPEKVFHRTINLLLLFYRGAAILCIRLQFWEPQVLPVRSSELESLVTHCRSLTAIPDYRAHSLTSPFRISPPATVYQGIYEHRYSALSEESQT